MVDRSEAYYLFFKAVQGLEDVLDFVYDCTDTWNAEIEYFRGEIDTSVEKSLCLSITHDWSHAFQNGGFQDVWMEYEEFADKNFRPYFEGGDFGLWK